MTGDAGGRGESRRATSVDVAREAGLSRTTVSFVLNDTPHQKIPEGTRQKVWEAANRLGYTSASPAARALRTGRSDIVLCVLPDVPIGPAVGNFLDELAAHFEVAGFTLLACPRSASHEPLAKVWTRITPAAVVSTAVLDDQDIAEIKAAGIEVVVSGAHSTADLNAYEFSDEHVGRLQVQHLADRGHRRLGFAYPTDPRMAPYAAPRLEGARKECARLGLPAPVKIDVDLSVASATAAVVEWTTADPRVTAVCAYNDDLALAVLAALRLSGFTAPGDLAVVGMDDVPGAAFAAPALTTLRPNNKDLTRGIAEEVLCRMNKTTPPPRSTARLMLVTREST